MGAPLPPWTARIFTWLLHAYPAAFREEYGSEMRAAFRARWRESHGAMATIRLWSSVLIDTIGTAPRAHLEMTMRDARYAVRAFAHGRNRSFAVASILTLALGIGAVTTVFSVARAVLFAPLPFRDPSRVVSIAGENVPLGLTRFSESTPNFVSLSQRTRAFTGLVAMKEGNANITVGSQPERAVGLAVSTGFFDVLGLMPVAGRAFVDGDSAPGAAVAMISRGLWARRFGSNPAAIGSTIEINLRPHVIVGVAPQDAGFASDVDLWTPLDLREPEERRSDRRLSVLGRLAPGVSLEQARDDLQRIAVALESEFPAANRNWRYAILPVREWIVAPDLAVRLRMLLAAVALLLLVAAANVANLQIARAAGRLREIGVRLALGASHARLARQILTETMLLAFLGGAAGLGVAWMGVRVAASLLGDDIPRANAIAIDVQVLAVAIAATMLTALVAGLVPASLALRSSVSDALGQAGRSPTGGRTPVRRVLVAVQVGLATALVIGAALIAQSLSRLQRVPLGFADPDRLLTVEITRSDPAPDNHEQDLAFYDAVVERVSALPGVKAAAITSGAPFGNGNTAMPIEPYPNNAGAPVAPFAVSWRIVSGDYFRTMQIPLESGRFFGRATDPLRAMVLSSGLARTLWPGRSDLVGRTVRLGNGQVFTVIGIAGDVRLVDLARGATPTMYIPASFFLWPTMTLVVRTAGEPSGLSMPIRRAVAAIDPHQPLSGFQTMQAAVAGSVAAPRLNAWVLSSFAVLALVLAAVGIAGLVSYSVTQRGPELAVRMAIGASPGRAMWHVMEGLLKMCVAGIAAGTAAALLSGRVLGAVLFGIGPADPLTYAVTASLLVATAALAAWIPARRTTQINPARALR